MGGRQCSCGISRPRSSMRMPRQGHSTRAPPPGPSRPRCHVDVFIHHLGAFMRVQHARNHASSGRDAFPILFTRSSRAAFDSFD